MNWVNHCQSQEINRLPAFVELSVDYGIGLVCSLICKYRAQKNAGNDDCISGVMMNSAKALSGIICTERTP